jgi:hypothetical protein
LYFVTRKLSVSLCVFRAPYRFREEVWDGDFVGTFTSRYTRYVPTVAVH